MRRAGFIFPVVALWAPATLAEEPAAELPPPSAELLVARPRSAGPPLLHPPIVLRDARGVSVLASGQAASPARTCDGCHDVGWIEAHDYHSSMVADELGREAALLTAGNCFLCHVAQADPQARARALASGRPDDAPTATLAGTGLVEDIDGRWQWRQERFGTGGTVAAAALGLGRPSDRACGFCHGLVWSEPAPLVLGRDRGRLLTEREGAIFSGQRISDSAMNLAGKDGLTRPWDVHAERMVSCASCHFSPNHPAYSYVDRGLEHLQFDARRLAITEYLRRPDHRFARGPSGSAHREGNLRRCESCHDASKVHRWLPRAERHFAALMCETCHVPAGLAPAREVTDWTMLTASREPRVTYRGLQKDGFVEGFRPVLLPRAADGTGKLAPNNLITTFQWVESQGGQPRSVARAVLERAFFAADGHRPEILAALDVDHDGRLQESELVLDSVAKVKVARDLLLAAGARAPEIVGEVAAHELHHGVSPGRFATRDCADCHAPGSRIDAPMVLASALPFGVNPSFAVAGTVLRDAGGRLVFAPKAAGLHVFGHTRNAWLDGLGVVLLVGVILGSGGHALLRLRAARRRSKERR